MGPLQTFGNRVVVGWRFRPRQYVEMNALSSGTNGKPSSSYRVAVCGEHATYNSIISTLR